jgi:hypothetical protein
MIDALEESMTNDEQPAIHPGCIRIIVKLGEHLAAGDFAVKALPEWMLELERSADRPMTRGTHEGAAVASEMAFEGCRIDQWDLACIAALWLILYSPSPARTTMDDLIKLADTGVIKIVASADGAIWHCEVSDYSNEPGHTVH